MSDTAPMLPPGPVPTDGPGVSFEKHVQPHPLIPGEAPPGWVQPGQEQAASASQQPPPGWIGAWHPPVPPKPTDDPSTWPQLGVGPGAGPNVGSWAVREAAPEDRD